MATVSKVIGFQFPFTVPGVTGRYAEEPVNADTSVTEAPPKGLERPQSLVPTSSSDTNGITDPWS